MPLRDSGQMPRFEFGRRLKRHDSLKRLREAAMFMLNLVENNVELMRTERYGKSLGY